MTRAGRYAQIKPMRDSGMLLREIAEATGLSTSTVHDILLDPSGEAARRRKRRYERPCVDCGTTINPNGIRAEVVRCLPCNGKHVREMSRRWILDSINEWVDLFGVPPTALDWNPALARTQGSEWKADRYEATGRAWPSVSLCQDNFGSWRETLIAAGYEPFESGHYGREGEDPVIVAETIRLYRSGLTLEEVGERMGCSGAAVLHRLRKAGEPRRPAGRRAAERQVAA